MVPEVRVLVVSAFFNRAAAKQNAGEPEAAVTAFNEVVSVSAVRTSRTSRNAWPRLEYLKARGQSAIFHRMPYGGPSGTPSTMLTHRDCAVNEHVFLLRAIPEVGQSLLFFWLAQDETRQRIVNLNANTAQPGVSQSKLKTLGFVQPTPAVARLFNETVEPTIHQVFVLAQTSRRLAQARDLLLPRLMNDDISV